MQKMMESIATEVRVEMARQQISGTALADAFGQSQQWFHRRTSGKVAFTAGELFLIAHLLNCPVYQFFEKVELPRLDSNQQPSD